ncbi:MAG: putative bifunctional diguanylate cyclase/phosphodiesterase [Sphingomonadaceae bacterium]
MQQAIITFWHRAIDRKNRVFIWASLLVLVLTLAEGLQPLDHLSRLSRSGLFLQDAKPKLAIVLVDNASINRFGEWPWERKDIANLVTAIDRAGAKRMAFEHVFVPNQDDAGTAALARAFDALPQRPIIAASYEIDRAGSERKLKWPDRQLSAHAQVAISSFPISYMGYLLTIENSVLVDGHELPSMAAALAGQPKNRGLDDYVDYSIRPESIPQVSATDVLAGRANDQLKGRQVLISSSRNEVLLPRVGSARFVMGHAMSAATLMEGAQRHIGPMPALIIGFLSSWLIWFRRRRTAIGATVMAGLAYLIIPSFFELQRIYVDIAPALVLTSTIVLARLWRSYRRGGELTNQLSGLPNLLALRDYQLADKDIVLALHIRNYPALAAALSRCEDKLVAQIVQRFQGAGVELLFHGDQGVFCWISAARSPTQLAEHLEALHNLFRMPLVVEGRQVDLTLACGLDDSSSHDPQERFANALVAASEAAKAGLRWKVHDAAPQDEAEWKMSLLGQLDAAIDHGEVWVAYQAKYDPAAGRVSGAEALARWSHPQRGPIAPDEFIPVAEASGRIDKLTYFVLDQALALAAKMGPDFDMAVNLSAQMFSRTDFAEKLALLLIRHKVAPKNLTLEITESAAVQSEADMLSALSALADLGVTVSIDDYGTGYSTLEYLRKIQPQELKIDRSFVATMDRNRADRLLVSATIKLAHSLGHSVVAEGVETKDTFDMLRRMGCDKAQGYYISRPVPQADFVAFMESAAARAA